MSEDHRGTSDDGSAGPAHSLDSRGVSVLDDREVVRRGLRLLLESDGVSVMGESTSAADAIRRVPALHPGLVIVDDDLPDGTGAEVCRAVAVMDPGIRCVLLTAGAEEAVLIEAVFAGAWGCLSKEDDGAEQLRLIRRALAWHIAYSKRFQASSIAGESRPGAFQTGNELVNLSKQEKTAAYGMGRGLSNYQISQRMNLSEKTVKNMVSSVLMKLGMERRSQAAVLISTILQPWEDTQYGNYRFSPFPDRIAKVADALRACTSEANTVPPTNDERARDAVRLTTALTAALASVLFLKSSTGPEIVPRS